MTVPGSPPVLNRRAAWILCFLVSMIEGFDLQAAGVTAPRLAPALGIGSGNMGLFFSAATIGLIVGALIGGRLADRIGRRSGLLLALTAFGVCSIATAFAWNFPSLFAFRFLTGVGLGGALPNLIAIAAETNRGRASSAVAAMYAGMPAGGAVAALLSVLDAHGPWQLIFVIGGVAPLIVAPFVLFLLPALRIRRSGAGGSDLHRTVRALFGPGQWQRTIALWIGFFFALVVLYLLLNWLPVLLVARGMGPTQAGTVQIVFNVAGSAGSLLAGWGMEGARRRHTVLICFGGVIVALTALALTPANFVLVLVAGAVVGGTVMGTQAILYGLAPAQYPVEVRGTGVGAAVAVGRLGSVAGPLLAGLLLAAGKDSAQILMGIAPIAILGGLATLYLVGAPGRRKNPEEIEI
ncbi:MAG: 3-(3-hydroxy-phenyl)propionate transporter MhpT [Sphingomonas sp.]